MINPKVTAGAIAGAVSIILIFVLGLFGISVEPAVAQALSTVLAFGAGYLTSDNKEGTPDGV